MTTTRLLATLLLAGCSYTFDGAAPELPLVGAPPDTPSLPHLNSAPVDGEVFALGADKRIWLVLSQTDKSWRMVAMSGDPTVETLAPGEVDDLSVTWRALYLTKRPKPGADGGVPPDLALPPNDMGHSSEPPPPIELTVRSIGEHPGHTFTLPGAPAVIYSFGADDVFAYIVTGADQPGYIIQRRDGSYRRIVPWPKGVDPANPFKNGGFFSDSGAGKVFYDRDIDGRVVGHHTTDNRDVDLGIRPRFLAWIDANTLITCGDDGLRVVPADGVTSERILDEDPCRQQLLYFNAGYVYYDVGFTVRKAKLDGSTPPEPLFEYGQNRVLAITPHDDVIYSTDPADRYVHSAGDGWLGHWRFMQRGTGLSVSSDRTRIYWLESSAQNSGAGNLTMVKLSAPGVPGGTPVTLTRNTRQVAFLADGRLLADENHAFGDTSNRIVTIDQLRHKKQWVATSASRFSSIPFSDDLIVDVVSGATGHDVVRVKVPPPDPPPPPQLILW